MKMVKGKGLSSILSYLPGKFFTWDVFLHFSSFVYIVTQTSTGFSDILKLTFHPTFSHVGACSAQLRYARRGCGYILPSLRSRPWAFDLWSRWLLCCPASGKTTRPLCGPPTSADTEEYRKKRREKVLFSFKDIKLFTFQSGISWMNLSVCVCMTVTCLQRIKKKGIFLTLNVM